MKHLAVASLLLVACGGVPRGPIQTTCETAGLLREVTSDAALDCAGFQRNLVRAVGAITSRGILSEAEGRTFFVEVAVFVSAEEELAPDAAVYGSYGWDDIELARSTGSLAHELLHHVDKARMHLTSRAHVGWDTNGYESAISDYQSGLRRP